MRIYETVQKVGRIVAVTGLVGLLGCACPIKNDKPQKNPSDIVDENKEEIIYPKFQYVPPTSPIINNRYEF